MVHDTDIIYYMHTYIDVTRRYPYIYVTYVHIQRCISEMSGVVFVEMAMEAARQHLGPEAQLRDVQMVWPFVVPKAMVEWVEFCDMVCLDIIWPGEIQQQKCPQMVARILFLAMTVVTCTFATCRAFAAGRVKGLVICCFHPQDGDSDAKQMTMRLAIIGGSFICPKQMEINSTPKCHKHMKQFMGQTWIGQMLLEYRALTIAESDILQ